jgi:tRNA (guanine10-N2)-methyltransferase
MPLYLLRISLQHPTFRLPSLKSIADLYEFPLKFISEDRYRSALVVELRNDQDAMRIAERGTMVMYVFEPRKCQEDSVLLTFDRSVNRLWAEGNSYEEIHSALQVDPTVWIPYAGKRFKFTLESANHKTTKSRQRYVAVAVAVRVRV